MAMEMKLNLKMAQKLVMTPMLQQAIKLLPLARLELAQLVRQELVDNPILEELIDEESFLEDEDGEPEASPEDNLLDSLGETPVDGDKKDDNDPIEQEVDWENFLQDNYEYSPSPGAEAAPERPSIEATYKKDPSLSDHLHWQLSLTVDSDEDKFIGSCIIGNIQSDGYCTAELSELAEISNSTVEDVERILKIMQTFEPLGVCARTLQECLMIQAQALPERLETVEILIDKYLEKINERFYQKIANELKRSVEEIIDAIEIIRSFDPKPGFNFSSEGTDYVIPDLVVLKNEKGEYDVTLNDEGIPRITISPYYQTLLKSSRESETKEYLENKYRSAMWLIKSIDQRRQTIYKVGKSIVKLQKEFLDEGLAHLRPMVLRDVAQDIEMHESTVSRITTNKYIDTPQGIFELKFFFHSGIKSYTGDNNLSSIRVKTMIKEIVQDEDPKKPYTDDEMVEILMKKNAKIARRTVTKYRKELNLPPASKRKKFY
ncbi:RNA polymerase, sigma-54 factor (Sigma N) [Nitrospina watsonii]|uniref:RNA polymerase, sigma-54 factor (Sigma N) n=2 Tax=Nitrospina watsonii TaxID=1323948 RepID=A0ABN8VXF6_9BACT|nr:RNA polymerase, sigma-54 factor (Sigma N) [Nitrospina watsonii]